jgi:aminocarboxymuconate-semialdehyde decarboxylase
VKIDVHTHILPRDLPRWKDQLGEGGFVQLEHVASSGGPCRARMVKDDGTFFRDVEEDLWDPAARLRACAAADVDVQVLSTVPVMFSYWARPESGLAVARFLNDHVAAVAEQNPRRFVALGTLPLQDPDLAIDELRRCMKLGMAGVQIGTNVNGAQLSDPTLFPVFAEAAALGAAVFIHPWDMMGHASMKKYWLPWLVGMPAECAAAICALIFGGVLERLPTLRVCVAHGGGSFPFTLGRVQHGFEARPDLCAVDNDKAPLQYAGRFWVDGLVHDPRALRFLLDVVGDDKVCVGSDYPFPLGEARPGALVERVVDDPRVRARLFRDNALAWLGLPASRFEDAA